MNISGTVNSELNYIKPDTALVPEVFYSGGPAPQRYSEAYEFMPATINDARESGGVFSIHKQGIELVTARTANKVFDDDQVIKDVYYDEVVSIVKDQTGAEDVFVFDHTVRLGKRGSLRKPAHHVHNDYTEKTAHTRAEECVGELLFSRMTGRRMIQINVWRPLVDVVKRSPLAFCAADSIDQNDLIPTKIHFPDTDHVGEIYALRKASAQRWFYFSEMTGDEVVLIKGYDSLKEGVARFTPHTAFEYPDQDPDFGARHSIETRTFAFY